MSEIQQHPAADGDAVPADATDETLEAAHRLIDAIVTGYDVLPDVVTHPRWCDPTNCSVRPGRATGTHQSEHHTVTTATAVITLYLEDGTRRGIPLLVIERRARGYAEQEPFTTVTLPAGAAREFVAAGATLVEDLGPVAP